MQGQRSPSASATPERTQTPAQRQGLSKPSFPTACSCLHQPTLRLWNFSIGPSNARGKQILGAAYPGQGIHSKAGWKRYPKKCPHTTWEGLHTTLTQMTPWLLSSYTSMPDAKSRKYVLSHSTQTCKCRGNLKRIFKKSSGKGLTLVLFTAWWGRKRGRKGRNLSSATMSSSHSFEEIKQNFKVYLTPKIRWKVVGLTWRSLQAETGEKTNRTPDFQGPWFALE